MVDDFTAREEEYLKNLVDGARLRQAQMAAQALVVDPPTGPPSKAPSSRPPMGQQPPYILPWLPAPPALWPTMAPAYQAPPAPIPVPLPPAAPPPPFVRQAYPPGSWLPPQPQVPIPIQPQCYVP